jgi:hypothetical protein
VSVDGSREAVLLRGLAGLPRATDEVEASLVRWEGDVYRVALQESLLERLEGVRRRQGRSLDAALQVLGAAPATPTVVAVRTAIDRLQNTALDEAGRRTVEELSIRAASLRDRDEPRTATIAARLTALGDRMFADSLSSLVYATALAEASEWLPDARDLDLRHDHEMVQSRSDGMQAGWELPVEVAGPAVPWHVTGSLLGMDLVLAPLRLRRISSEPPTREPRLNENDRRTFVQSVALLNPALMTDADRDAIAAGLRRGRERAAALAERPDDLKAALAETGLSAWRARAAEWTIVHEPARLSEIWSTRELLALGDGREPDRFDRWGLSALPIDGSLRTRLCDLTPWESVAGRPMTGRLAAFGPDLNLRMAEALAAGDLPAVLAPAALAGAVQSLIDEVQPAYMDDWHSLVTYVRRLPAERFEDYISLLTADGPMVSVTGEARTESR